MIKLRSLNKQPIKCAGVTLVEVVIVLAISVIFVLIALTVNQDRGRRDFDNSMKLMVQDIRAIQEQANANLGPDDPAYCDANPPDVNILNDNTPNHANQKCPSKWIYGAAITLAPGNWSPASFVNGGDYDFGAVPSKSDGNVTQNYYTYRVGLTPPAVALGKFLTATYSFGPVPQHSLPPNIGYKGSCLTSDIGCTAATPNTSDPVILVYGRRGFLTPNDPQVTSALNLGLNVFRQVSFAGTASPDPAQYSTNPAATFQNYILATYRQKTTLYFVDVTSKYRGSITIDPTNNNQIDLSLQ